MLKTVMLLKLLFYCISSICQAKVESLGKRILFLTPINNVVINLLKYIVTNGILWNSVGLILL